MEKLEELLKSLTKTLTSGTDIGQWSLTDPEKGGERFDYISHERKMAELYNRSKGNRSDCPVCMGRGDFERITDDGYTVYEECECMKRQRSLRRLKRSGLDESLTLDNWQMTAKWQQTACAAAREFAEKPDGWFFVSGNPGTGKTHLCAGLCRLLIDKGMETRYLLWRDTVIKLNAVANDAEEFSKLMRPLQTVKVLYIDDFFKSGGEKPSTGDKNRAFEIINARYNSRGLITVISSEWTTGAMDSIDEAVASRIYQRAGKYNLDFTGKPNWRRRG